MKKTTIVLTASLLVSVTLCSLSLPQQDKAKNLKVLPKNISHEELDKVMKGFNTALGVKCNYCHAPQQDNPKRLDFASDEKENKKVAREMMRMTQRINKKYFKDYITVDAVTCYTCHHGSEEPQSGPAIKQ